MVAARYTYENTHINRLLDVIPRDAPTESWGVEVLDIGNFKHVGSTREKVEAGTASS